MTPSRPHGPHDRELNYVSPSAAHRATCREYVRLFLSQSAARSSHVASVGTISRACNCPGAGGSDTAIAVEPRNFVAAREPGSNARRDSAESLESIGGLHPSRMENVDGKVRVEGNSKNSGACRD